MKSRKNLAVQTCSVLLLLLFTCAKSFAIEGVEYSYHGHMGYPTGVGMVEKWCALPNFSFDEQGGIEGWSKQSCNGCHVGAAFNPARTEPDCTFCHTSPSPVAGNGDIPTVAACLNCHVKDTAKRGDVFLADSDVHIARGMICQDCHERVTEGVSDHQFLKGTAIDTTEPTLEGTLSCVTSGCHSDQPHHGKGENANKLNQHVASVACETCHTGFRPAAALESRKWNVFTEEGKPVTTKREPGWLPTHKWYDNTGPGASGNFHLPILSPTERRGEPFARIYPFNTVSVDWFVKDKDSSYEDVIIVPEVKAADANLDGTVTVKEMRAVYKKAELIQADMTFSINHSVVPAKLAFDCGDCHGSESFVLDWKALGYRGDPVGKKFKARKK